PSRGMASRPPPIPSTPPTNPIDAPASRQPATTTYQSTCHPFATGASAQCPSSTQTLHGGLDTVHGNDLQALDGLARRIGPGDQRHAETELGRFLQPFLAADGGTD